MTTGELLLQAWDWEPTVILGSILLLFAYLWLARFRFNGKTVLFAFGVVLMCLTLVGPLDFLGDDYLFSSHMLEHLLLELAVPPLLIMGIPASWLRTVLQVRTVARIERFLRRPVVAWLVAVPTLWVWHLPVLYNAALDSEGVHAVQHLSMLVTSTIFWWPVFTPLPEHRISPIGGFVYLFVATCANMILGILLTFSPLGYYPRYMRAAGADQVFRLIRTVWELDPQSDLNLGGMFMWIFGGLIYFAAMLEVISRLYRHGRTPQEGGGS